MELKNVNDVKKWLRNIPLVKKELKLKAEFFGELSVDFRRASGGLRHAEEYREKTEELYRRIEALTAETDRLFGMLSGDERLIMTAKYIRLIKWDYIELHTYYSRRQAIRIHNRALQRLVGQKVSEGAI